MFYSSQLLAQDDLDGLVVSKNPFQRLPIHITFRRLKLPSDPRFQLIIMMALEPRPKATNAAGQTPRRRHGSKLAREMGAAAETQFVSLDMELVHMSGPFV